MRVVLAGEGPVGSERGVVAAQHPVSAAAGAHILARGGNVVDAAVAAVFGAAVADIGRTSIGGYGGHLVYHQASGETWVVDFPSCAPRAAHASLLDDAARQGSEWWRAPERVADAGPLAVAVPAVVAGMAAAHARFGRLAWADLLAPAIQAADEGIVMAGEAQLRVHEQRPRIGALPGLARLFLDGWAGDTLRQPELAATLRMLADEGPRAMYGGALGQRVVEAVQALGGVLDEDDLASYSPTVLSARGVNYRGREVRCPGPQSGGGALIPVLGALDHFDLTGLEALGAERIAVLLGISGRIWPDRLASAGALATGNLAEALLQPAYWSHVAADVRVGVFSSEPITAAGEACTNHLSVADADGNVVSATTTMRTILGSGVVVPDAGFALNNGMGLFERTPGHPNSVGPGKGLVTNMCPTVVLRDGRAALATGASGGRLIASMVSQILSLVVDHGWAPERALGAPRMHHEGGGQVRVEDGLPPDTLDGLARRGFRVETLAWGSPDLGGQSPAVWYDEQGRVWGAADPRRHGAAVGVAA